MVSVFFSVCEEHVIFYFVDARVSPELDIGFYKRPLQPVPVVSVLARNTEFTSINCNSEF
jgi:hypothetical protein